MGNQQMCCPQNMFQGGQMSYSINPVKHTSKLRIFEQEYPTSQIKMQQLKSSSLVQPTAKNQLKKQENYSVMSNQKQSQHGFQQSQKLSRQSSHIKKQVQKIIIPELSPQIKIIINKLSNLVLTQEPFQKQLDSRPIQNIKVKKFKEDIYEGQLDAFGRPQGYGRLYKSNGNFLIADFINGVVQNVGIAIMKNGSYYLGSFKKNEAHDLDGRYVCEQFQYQGGFANNMLNGQGTQNGQNYSFHGTYKNNMKIRGTYSWEVNSKSKLRENDKVAKFNYEYNGDLDKDQLFTGIGKLRQPKGTYKGQFARGKKHGKGTYIYLTKLKYQGEYYQNVKQGLGILSNYDQSIAYKGEWKNGLPNGKGSLFDQKGNQIVSTFIDGLSTEILPASQTDKLNQALERAGL